MPNRETEEEVEMFIRIKNEDVKVENVVEEEAEAEGLNCLSFCTEDDGLQHIPSPTSELQRQEVEGQEKKAFADLNQSKPRRTKSEMDTVVAEESKGTPFFARDSRKENTNNNNNNNNNRTIATTTLMSMTNN